MMREHPHGCQCQACLTPMSWGPLPPPQPRYDTTLARMAGTIAAGLVSSPQFEIGHATRIAEVSVVVARAIVAEVERTEPRPEEGS